MLASLIFSEIHGFAFSAWREFFGSVDVAVRPRHTFGSQRFFGGDSGERELAQQLSGLEDPPITEVVCGVFFTPVSNLDPVTLGEYWLQKKDAYPRREFKTAIVRYDRAEISVIGPDLGPIRTWFISKDDVFILQVQNDRLYLNWRAKQNEYPRFNDWDGKQGLLSRFLFEQRSFEEFCATAFGYSLELQGIELAKVDHLERGRHWSDAQDLAKLIPMLGKALELAEQEPQLQAKFRAPRTNGFLEVTVTSGERATKPPTPVIKVETRREVRRLIRPGELKSEFKAANDDVNNLFFRLVPEREHIRFGKDWRP